MQGRLHGLVTDKIRNAKRQLTELHAFTAQLQVAAAQLSRDPVDGPCDDDCACATDRPETGEGPVPVTSSTEPDDPPIACTLEPAAMPDRLADWRAFLGQARSPTAAPDGSLRVELGEDVDLGELARLVAAERHCCGFFSFAITVDPRGIALEVRCPDGAEEIVASLFGRPA